MILKDQKKKKKSKKLEEEENDRNGDHMEGYQRGKQEGERVGKGTENEQHKWQVENRQGEVKNSMGNVEAKELIGMTHGHELKGGMEVGGGVQGRGE